jgi:hypothetical protein
MYPVEAMPTAAKMLAKAPGLQARVEEVLRGILATAEEIRLLQGHDYDLGGHLRVQVADHVITYVLDLDRHRAKVVFVERTADRPASENPSA